MPKPISARLPLLVNERALRTITTARKSEVAAWDLVAQLRGHGDLVELRATDSGRALLEQMPDAADCKAAAIQRAANLDKQAAEYRAKVDRLISSSLTLIRTKLIDTEPHAAAAIIVGLAPSIYSDRAKAISEWEKVVTEEQRKAHRTSRGKSAISRRKNYRAAVKALDPPKSKKLGGMHWSADTGRTEQI